MAIAKRIFLFIVINLLVITMITIVLQLFNVRPFIQAYGLDYKALLLFCLIWGMGGAFISLALSRKMAKWMMGVKIIDPENQTPEQKFLMNTVKKLAEDAGLGYMPEVGIYQSNEVNAFATGPTKKRSLVAVSSGLLSRMEENEIKAILGHEISHIMNGDMVTMTLVQGVVNAFVMFLARALAYTVSGMGRNRSTSSSYFSYIMFVFLFQIVFMILGSIVIAAYSRFREYRADSGGARLAGKEKMISALKSLRVLQEIRDPKSEKPSIQSLKISAAHKKGLLALFATHPPIEKRIERLEQTA